MNQNQSIKIIIWLIKPVLTNNNLLIVREIASQEAILKK